MDTHLLPSNLNGTGILYLKHKSPSPSSLSSLIKDYHGLGFWYTSTVSCTPQIHVILLDSTQFKLPSHSTYGLTLPDLHNIPNIQQIKLLSIKDKSKESTLRSFIYSSISSSNPSSIIPHDILCSTLEKIVISASCPLIDYLHLISLLHTIQSNPTHTQPEHDDFKRSNLIEKRINHALNLLKPYFEKHNTNGSIPTTADSISAAMTELESKLFDNAAIINF